MHTGLKRLSSRCNSTGREGYVQTEMLQKDPLVELLAGLATKKFDYYDIKSGWKKYIYDVFSALTKEKRLGKFFGFYAHVLSIQDFPVLNIPEVVLLYRIWMRSYEDLLYNFIENYSVAVPGMLFWKKLLKGLYYADDKKLNAYLVFLPKIALPQFFSIEKITGINNIVESWLVMKLPSHNPCDFASGTAYEAHLHEKYAITFESLEKINQLYLVVCRQNDGKAFQVLYDFLLSFISNFDADIHDKEITGFLRLEFFCKLFHLLNAEQLANMGTKRINHLADFYNNNSGLIVNTIDTLADNFDASDFSNDPSQELFLLLFIRFRIPKVLVSHFYVLNRTESGWLTHVLSGNNLCTAEHLPFKLSKKAAHLSLEQDAIYGYNIQRTLLYLQILAMGGNQIAYNFMNSAAGYEPHEFYLWESFIMFCINNNVKGTDVGPLVDYINYCKKQDSNYSLKGRNANTLLRDMQIWHTETMRQKALAGYRITFWHGHDIDDYQCNSGDDTYTITQLHTTEELFEEGLNQHHCVLTYTNYCISGMCSIWSLRMVTGEEKPERMVTMEIRNRRIVQARGKYNRMPTRFEHDIINDWAEKNNIFYD